MIGYEAFVRLGKSESTNLSKSVRQALMDPGKYLEYIFYCDLFNSNQVSQSLYSIGKNPLSEPRY